MIILTSITALELLVTEIDEKTTKVITTNKVYHKWLNLNKEFSNMKQLNRFRHLLKFYMKQCKCKKVDLLLSYFEK